MSTKIIATAIIAEWPGEEDGFSAEAAFRYARENPNAKYVEVFPGDVEGLEYGVAVVWEGEESGFDAALRAACPDAFGDEEPS